MKYIYPILGIAGLLMLIIPATLVFSGKMDTGQMKDLMLIGTLIWFAAAIPWLGRKNKEKTQ